MIPGSSRSSATSSAESLYSTAGSVPRRRKLSAAEDVAARVRARWAALEALERTTGASRAKPHADKENASVPIPMQIDTTYEKPLPPRPPPLALHICGSTDDSHTMVMMDTREDAAPAPPASVPAAAAAAPAGSTTVRTTPTSLTFVDENTDSAAALQRRPTTTRAVTPPQVRRRASITDELEEAVSWWFTPLRGFLLLISLVREKKRLSRCFVVHVQTAYYDVPVVDAENYLVACGLSRFTCIYMLLVLVRTRACDAEAHLRVRESSRGMLVRVGGREVRFVFDTHYFCLTPC